MKQQQNLNFDQTDETISNEHTQTRNELYEITTGSLYTEWKNSIVDDNLKRAKQLESELDSRAQIDGKDPEMTFQEQKSMNISLRKMFLEAMKKDYTAALEKEKTLEREEEQAGRVLKQLRSGKERKYPSDINEQNIDPASSEIAKLSSVT